MSRRSSVASEETGPSAEASDESPLARLWHEWGSLVVAIAVALAIRAVVIEPFRIPSESMLPTLLIGDHLFVNKFVYGVKVPFTDLRVGGLRDPERGDVVVFTVARDPRDPSRILPVDKYPDFPREEFVKRIVGLPGDRVEWSADGSVRVNGRALEREQRGVFETQFGRELDVFAEVLGECKHEMLDDPERPVRSGARQVPEGRYFMMGDNRDYSNDRRSWGTVRSEQFKGPALFIYWSWKYSSESWLPLLNPWTWWSTEKRWERFGSGIGCEEPPGVD